MLELPETVLQALLGAAQQARSHSYSPYSRHAVGAAVLDERGAIHAGCNVENAAYPQGWCAEATALGAMVMAGGAKAIALLVTGPGPGVITPCGGCRQKLREFGSPDTLVIAADPGGVKQSWTLEQLLPESFGPEHLSV